ncbi:hypothetical protein DFJ73DRAFT_950704, partial [Zopfochytrium polystomum]
MDCLPFLNTFNALPPWFKTEFAKGQVSALEWTVAASVNFDTLGGTDPATVNGQVGVLDWWRRSGLDLTHEYEMDKASLWGHVGVVQWWKDSGLPLMYKAGRPLA